MQKTQKTVEPLRFCAPLLRARFAEPRACFAAHRARNAELPLPERVWQAGRQETGQTYSTVVWVCAAPGATEQEDPETERRHQLENNFSGPK